MIVNKVDCFYAMLGSIAVCVHLTLSNTAVFCQTPDTLKAIEKTWNARQQRIRSAHVSWVEKHTVTKGLVTDMARMFPGGERRLAQMGIAPGSTVPPQDVSFHITASFSFDGTKARLDYDDRQWSATEKAYVPQPQVILYDGHLSKDLLVKGTPYTPWPFGHVTGGHPFRGSLIVAPLAMTLCPMHPETRVFELNALVATGQRAVIDGKSCLELQRRSGNFVTHLWIDPSRDFLMLRFLSTIHERTLNKLDVHYHKDTTGEWLPDKWERVSFRTNGGLERSVSAKVTAAHLNLPEDPRAYELNFPERTLVLDQSMPEQNLSYIVREGGNKRIIAPEEASLSYEQLLHAKSGGVLGDPWAAFSSLWFWASALTLMAAGWVLWKIRATRKPGAPPNS